MQTEHLRAHGAFSYPRLLHTLQEAGPLVLLQTPLTFLMIDEPLSLSALTQPQLRLVAAPAT